MLRWNASNESSFRVSASTSFSISLRYFGHDRPEFLPVERLLGDGPHVGEVLRLQGRHREQLCSAAACGVVQPDERVEFHAASAATHTAGRPPGSRQVRRAEPPGKPPGGHPEAAGKPRGPDHRGRASRISLNCFRCSSVSSLSSFSSISFCNCGELLLLPLGQSEPVLQRRRKHLARRRQPHEPARAAHARPARRPERLVHVVRDEVELPLGVEVDAVVAGPRSSSRRC